MKNMQLKEKPVSYITEHQKDTFNFLGKIVRFDATFNAGLIREFKHEAPITRTNSFIGKTSLL
jgi:hypothetical protein